MSASTRLNRAGLTAFSSLLCLVVACGGDTNPQQPCDSDCASPPAAFCDGAVSITFGVIGECTDGRCDYQPTSTTCAGGCSNGACDIAAACDEADCTEPPDNRCDGNTVLRYDAGACVDDECVYPATTEDCTNSGDLCRDAQCVPPEPGLCDEVVCVTPPGDRCDGNVRVTATDGACDPTSGSCTYEETRLDCAADGGFCRGGRCLESDPCTGISCTTPPAPSCDGDVPISYVAAGVCVADETAPDGYRCSHSEQRGATCTDGCADGACIDPACEIECVRPPTSSCTSAGVARRYADVGVCVDGGRCTYALTEENCTTAGLRCDAATVTCVADPCEGVDCSTPPPAECDGNVVVESTGSGTCTAGTCAWPVRFTDCGALFCDDGECVTRNPCSGITCGEPAPGPTCDGNIAVTAFDNSYCLSGECRWDEERVDCAEGGGVCEAGACIFDGRCPGGCGTPPADACLGAIARDYPSEGVCNVSNVCDYAPVDTNCRDLGLGCDAGRCIDLCDVITCNNPLAPRCDGGEAITYAAEGECNAGICAYEVTRTRCADLGLTCDAGACVSFDFCPTIICETPPQDVCDGTTAVQYTRDGTCNEGTDRCEYAATRVNCADTGRFCFSGACQNNDPCAGITCNTAPSNTCSADFAVRASLPGACVEGLCEFETTEYWCGLESAACLRGECVGGEFCDALDCDAEPGPTPYCDRDVRVTFDPRCRVGLCLWDIVRTSCRESGDYCFDGACIDVDPCSFTDCSEPPADECDGDLLYRYDPAGICAYADCSYDVDVINCADSDSFCAAGACRPNDNPCRDVVCETPGRVCADNDVVVQREPGICELGICLYADDSRIDCDVAPAPRCEGRVAVTWADDGACFDGECEYTETRVDCAASGRYCDRGVCALEDPCTGVTCGPAPAAQCVGDRVVTRAAGVCDSGVCRNDVVSEVDCTDVGRICAAGACVADPICSGVVCDAPPADYCVDTFRLRYAATGDCSRGECDYSAVRFDCRGLGQVCVDGECVPPASCDGVDCSGTPPGPVCDGDIAVTYSGTGDCAQGACVYLSSRTDCGNVRGGYCEAGVCANVCDGVVCDTPPAATCLGSTAATYGSGTCDAELGCVYPFASLNSCGDDGLVCLSGECVDLCVGVVCDEPPAPICAGNGVASYAEIGECSAGACLYDLLEPDTCGDDVCVEGICLPFDPCDVIACPAGPRCVGNQVFTSASEGTCVRDVFGAVCDYSTLTPGTDCAATGQVCVLGACFAGCDGVTCASGSTFCVGQIAVQATSDGTCTVEQGLPTCDFGDYETVVDCSETTDAVCLAGSCVNACAPVVCPEDGPYCVGDEAWAGTGAGICEVVDGEPACTYAAGTPVRNCADDGLRCVAGGCIDDTQFRITEIGPTLSGSLSGHSMLELSTAIAPFDDITIELFVTVRPTAVYRTTVAPPSGPLVLSSASNAVLTSAGTAGWLSWSGSTFTWPATGETLVVVVDGDEVGRYTQSTTWPWAPGVTMELGRNLAGGTGDPALPSSWCAAPREADATGNRTSAGTWNAICATTRLADLVDDVTISEVDPGGGGVAGYFELFNATGAPLDLSGVLVVTSAGDVTSLPAGFTTPRARSIVFASSVGTRSFTPDATLSGPVPAGSGTISVVDGDTTVRLIYGAASGISIPSGGSAQLDTLNQARLWCAAAIATGGGRRGSPGSANHSCIGAVPCAAAGSCPNPFEACAFDGGSVQRWLAPAVCTTLGCSYGQPTETEICERDLVCMEGECR